MLDYLSRNARRTVKRLGNLKGEISRFEGLGIKKRNILIILTLVLVMRLFFYINFDQFARANELSESREINSEMIDPLSRIKEVDKKNESKKICDEKTEVSSPENMLKNSGDDEKKQKYLDFLKGSPMENMVDFIIKKDRETAAFLVAIAKKESDWGRHAPSFAGRDCYNYWGYKGGYKPVQGYSCFDSPEQAVEVVGGRIDSLTEKGLNTPERMVVWKCGSSCSWDRPENVRSWIGAVRTYWQKLI